MWGLGDVLGCRQLDLKVVLEFGGPVSVLYCVPQAIGQCLHCGVEHSKGCAMTGLMGGV